MNKRKRQRISDKKLAWCKTGNAHRLHGLNGTRLCHIHSGMIARCYRPTTDAYQYYGEKGIRICDEWYTPGVKGNPGLVNFVNWAYSHGYNDPIPGQPKREWLSIERKNLDEDYSPENCIWIPLYLQSKNQTKTIHLFDGEETLVVADFERKYNLNAGYVGIRLKRGWSKSAIIHAAKNKDLGIHKLTMHDHIKFKKCGREIDDDQYYDKDNFIVLIPNIIQPGDDK